MKRARRASAAAGAAMPPGAVRAPMPRNLEPMLAVLIDQPFSDPDWLFELKWDGMRALAWVQEGAYRLRSRRDIDVTSQYPELAVLPERVALPDAILDGEIVALDESGRSNFQRLQSRMNQARPSPALIESVPVDYYVFDILYAGGHDLRGVPLIERKNYLKSVLDAAPPVRYSDHLVEFGERLFDFAVERGLEGIIGKRLASHYVSRRTRDWVKVKPRQEIEALIGGFTTPRRGRMHFGALLLGERRETGLEYIGSVGTGFDEAALRTLRRRLEALEIPSSPFRVEPKTSEKARWVRPELTARVKFLEWTADRKLRAPVFAGLTPE